MKKIHLFFLCVIAFQTKAQFMEANSDSFRVKLPIRLMNIGEGVGKVLTSDALGRATWQLPSGLWAVAGLEGNEIQNVNAGGFWSSYNTIVPLNATNGTNPPTAPVAGAGTRMMWIPSRSAFRAGTVNADAWDANNIGIHSFAVGYNSSATGTGNVAIGIGAISDGTSNTIAIGEQTQASGTNGTAIGTGTAANAYYSVALGYYNAPVAAANATSWVSTDPLLYIGNGQNANSLSNAMVIQKNGVINIGVTPNSSTTFKLKLGGSMSATGTVQALVLRSTNLAGTGERPVCTDGSGNLIECENESAGGSSVYNVSALGFHPVLSSTTPTTAFVRDVNKVLISFANGTKSVNAHAFAPVELPNGVTLGKMIMNYKQNAGGTMKLTFHSVAKQLDVAGTVEASISSVTGIGSIQESSVNFTTATVIDNSRFYYYLKLESISSWQGTDMALRGVIFTYKK